MIPETTDDSLVFQDPTSSLNPRKNVQYIVSEPLRAHKMGTAKEQKQKVQDILERVGLRKQDASRYVHQFSGGRRQRIAIARALISSPELIIADEPVSSLDVSVQAKIVNLMKDLQVEFNITFLFISHDLVWSGLISDKLGVMYLGKLMEVGTTVDIFGNPQHPYTEALLSAVPLPKAHQADSKERIKLKGEIPSIVNLPSGCRLPDIPTIGR